MARARLRDAGGDPDDRTLGADLVGMSTAPEVLAARHMGIRCLALSCVTNAAAGVVPEPIDHERVLEVGARAAVDLVALLREVVPALGTLRRLEAWSCATFPRSTGCSATRCSRPRPGRSRPRRRATALDRARRRSGGGDDPGDPVASARAELERLRTPSLRRVLNATGVIVHTNLGRAPLPVAALVRVAEVGARLLEPRARPRLGGARVATGPRRRARCARLTGAEAALVVNNNAAAVLLALAALAEGREVVVSRGELVEIGDGFRIPDVLARSGARMVEVGTTNRTIAGGLRARDRAGHGRDAARAPVELPDRGLHRRGPDDELARSRSGPGCRSSTTSARARSSTWATSRPPRRASPPAPTSSASRATSCSAAHRRASSSAARVLVERLRRHPLQRALRADKLTLAALDGTLALLADPSDRPPRDPRAADARRADRGRAARAPSGCGPARRGGRGDGRACRRRRAAARRAAERACAIEEQLAAALRQGEPPVVGIVRDGRLLLDARTLDDAEVDEAARAVLQARRGDADRVLAWHCRSAPPVMSTTGRPRSSAR